MPTIAELEQAGLLLPLLLVGGIFVVALTMAVLSRMGVDSGHTTDRQEGPECPSTAPASAVWRGGSSS